MEPTFRVGDLAVYPAHGVAQIVGIETREISGNKQTFYILKILENGMKIMIPTRNAGAVGLRELIRADEVDEVFAILKSREVAVEGQTWNRRYRDRKSTRLNSSHPSISYAVFCLKKKTPTPQ